MARPIADSAAATVRIYKANIWPIMSSKITENKIKYKLTPRSINSIDIRRISRCRLFKIRPKRPLKKIMEGMIKKKSRDKLKTIVE